MNDGSVQHLFGHLVSIACFVLVSVASCADRPDHSRLQLDDIIVTADKRPEPIQLAPASLTVLTGGSLESAGIDSVTEAAFRVPNLFLAGNTAQSLNLLQMRGLESSQGDPLVTVFIDDVPLLTDTMVSTDLLDIEQIEFLRGAQGALYGRNTLGGAVKITTRQLDQTPTLRGRFDAGEHGLRRYRLSGGGSAADHDIGYGLGLSWLRHDGYHFNQVTGSLVDEKDSIAALGRFRLLTQNNLDIGFTIRGQRDRNGGPVYTDVNSLRRSPFDIALSFDPETEREIVAPTLALRRFGDYVDLIAITGLQYWSRYGEIDQDFSAPDLIRGEIDDRQFYGFQEVRLTPSEQVLDADSSVRSARWVAGAMLSYSLTDRGRSQLFLPPFRGLVSPIEDTAEADITDLNLDIFGERSWPLTDRLSLKIGVSVSFNRERTNIEIVSPSVQSSVEDHLDNSYVEVLPKLGLTYRLAPQITTYVTAARGYRPGGYNLNSVAVGNFEYEEESSWTFETGMKTSWFDRRITANFAAFYIDWSDRQVSLPNLNAPGRFFLDNAAETTSKGVELEINAQVTPTIRAFTSAGYVDARIDEFILQTNSGADDLSGNRLRIVPEFTWNIGIAFERPVGERLTLFGYTDLTAVGKYHLDLRNTDTQNDFWLANARFGIGAENWKLTFWVKNAFDTEYFPIALTTNNGIVAENGPPQHGGVTLDCRY